MELAVLKCSPSGDLRNKLELGHDQLRQLWLDSITSICQTKSFVCNREFKFKPLATGLPGALVPTLQDVTDGGFSASIHRPKREY